ncbi:MAG: rhodanese-like domain-containing protein [Gammaproteobacteria bacterium]|nr:rhodanese-like domain-containing protein [Gammaproteobacteria bacterium]
MNRLFEYTTNHPFLVAAAAILFVLAIVIEVRHRARGTSVISPAQAVLLANSGAVVVDVRSAAEYEAGHIIDARHIPAAELASRADSLKKYKDKPILVYCDNGFVSAKAAHTLKQMGFTKVVSLRGGLVSWRQENLPLVKGRAKKGKA